MKAIVDRDAQGEWIWTLLSGNERTLALSGEKYGTLSECMGSLTLVTGSVAYAEDPENPPSNVSDRGRAIRWVPPNGHIDPRPGYLDRWYVAETAAGNYALGQAPIQLEFSLAPLDVS